MKELELAGNDRVMIGDSAATELIEGQQAGMSNANTLHIMFKVVEGIVFKALLTGNGLFIRQHDYDCPITFGANQQTFL